MNCVALLFRPSRLIGTRISPNWMLNSFAMRHSPTASRRLKPVPSDFAAWVPPTACVDLPRLRFSVSAKKKTFFATWPPMMKRTRRMQEVLLVPAGAVVRRVRDLLEVRLRLDEDAELEVDVVVDLDEGLGGLGGPGRRQAREEAATRPRSGRPQCAVRGNRHESVSPPRPDVIGWQKDNGTRRPVQSLMRMNHMPCLRAEDQVRQEADRERRQAGRDDARPARKPATRSPAGPSRTSPRGSRRSCRGLPRRPWPPGRSCSRRRGPCPGRRTSRRRGRRGDDDHDGKRANETQDRRPAAMTNPAAMRARRPKRPDILPTSHGRQDAGAVDEIDRRKSTRSTGRTAAAAR